MEGLLNLIHDLKCFTYSPRINFFIYIHMEYGPCPLQLNVSLDELEVSSLDEPVAYEKFLDESYS